jgi:hypothetical protein
VVGEAGLNSKHQVSLRVRSLPSFSVATILVILSLSCINSSACVPETQEDIGRRGAHFSGPCIDMGTYIVMKLLPNHPEQLCNTQLVRRWMMSQLAFLHQLSVFIICHSNFDKRSRLDPVTSSRFAWTCGCLRRAGIVLAEELVWREYFDQRGGTWAGQAVWAPSRGDLKRWCCSCFCVAVERTGASVLGQHWLFQFWDRYLGGDFVFHV